MSGGVLETQDASIAMQARLPVVDNNNAQIGTSDAAAGLTDAEVQPSVFVDGGSAASSTPSDAAAAEEKRMLEAIDGALGERSARRCGYHVDCTSQRRSV